MTVGFLFLPPAAVDGTSGYRTTAEIRDAVQGTGPVRPLGDLDRARSLHARDRFEGLVGVDATVEHDGFGGAVELPDALRAGHADDAAVVALEAGCCLVVYRPGTGADGGAGGIGEVEAVPVNVTGVPTDCRMRDSRDRLVTHVDRTSVRDMLDGDVAWRAGREGVPFVVVEPVDVALSPVPGVDFVQAAALPDGGWTVEHRSGGRILALAAPVPDVPGVVAVLVDYLDGEGESFLARDWRDTGVVPDDGAAGPGHVGVPSPVTFRFFRAADFDDAPGEYRSFRDFDLATPEFTAYGDSPAADADPVPGVLTVFADWMNRRAVQAAADPANPPANLYMDLTPYPVRPRGRMLTVTVPLVAHLHDGTFADLLLKAAALGLCMLEDSGRVWVNATGPASDCRMSLRGGGMVTTADPVAVRAVLESAVIAGTEGFVLSVEAAERGASPVAGVREVQVGVVDRHWIVHHLTTGHRFDLVDPGATVEDIVTVVGEFTAGDAAALLGREWTDISEGGMPDAESRWQLSDSAGGVVTVGDAEVHVAVPMNYGPELDWFQVADQVVPGNYITADRHLGTQWSVMWGHDYGEERYYRHIVGTREDAEALIHAWLDEPEQVFLDRGWDIVDND